MADEPKHSSRSGNYVMTAVTGARVRAFVPAPLPPEDLSLDGLHLPLERANRAIGRLDAIASLLPDARFLLYLFVCKEALVSSQIEGTQSSLADLLLFESKAATNVPKEDVEEVSTTWPPCNTACGVSKLAFLCPYG
jgi:hypothetical protein